ncbi:MAG: class I SAM-dependent methyltransferase [Chthoniobacterales bacterium]
MTPLHKKSTIQEIQKRFDNDVERFSNLETGQSATVDAPLTMELITQAAIAAVPHISRVLDIGCGAGNNTLKLLESYSGDFACDLCDLSLPMLERARERISRKTTCEVCCYHGDFREIGLQDSSYDVVLAAAVLHHLREKEDWEKAFEKIFRLLKPGGSVWITDLVFHENPKIQELMWQRYGEYLKQLGGEDYRDKVFSYINEEDSPRPLIFQLDLLRKVGFASVDVLHKNACFAAFGGVKTGSNGSVI